MTFSIPLYLPSLANRRMHWMKLAKLKQCQRWIVRAHLATFQPPKQLPATVTITRCGPRRLDLDNNVAACKAVVDELADWFGVDDGDPRYDWRFDQRKAHRYSVEIQIEGR